MLVKCLLRASCPYQILHRNMSSAFVVPFDHQSSGNITGVDAAQLWATTPSGDKPSKVGTTRTFYNTPPSKVTTVSSLGESFALKKGDVRRELVRKAVGSAVKDLKSLDGVKDVTIDASADPQAAGRYSWFKKKITLTPSCCSIAVAAHLALYKFTLKTSPPSPFNPNLTEPILEKLTFTPTQQSKDWDRGVIYAQSQNLARTVHLFLSHTSRVLMSCAAHGAPR